MSKGNQVTLSSVQPEQSMRAMIYFVAAVVALGVGCKKTQEPSETARTEPNTITTPRSQPATDQVKAEPSTPDTQAATDQSRSPGQNKASSSGPRGEPGARVTAAKSGIAALSTAVNLFEIDAGRYPTTEEGLDALVRAPKSLSGWHGPYVEKRIPNDPWGRPYVYRCPGTHNSS